MDGIVSEFVAIYLLFFMCSLTQRRTDTVTLAHTQQTDNRPTAVTRLMLSPEPETDQNFATPK